MSLDKIYNLIIYKTCLSYFITLFLTHLSHFGHIEVFCIFRWVWEDMHMGGDGLSRLNIVKGKTRDLKPLMAAHTLCVQLCAVVDLFFIGHRIYIVCMVVSFLKSRRFFFSLLLSFLSIAVRDRTTLGLGPLIFFFFLNYYIYVY